MSKKVEKKIPKLSIHYTPARIKGRAIFRSRPSTNNTFLSPVQFFPGIFPGFPKVLQ